MDKPKFVSIKDECVPDNIDVVLWPDFSGNAVVGSYSPETDIFSDNDGLTVAPSHWHHIGDVPENF